MKESETQNKQRLKVSKFELKNKQNHFFNTALASKMSQNKKMKVLY